MTGGLPPLSLSPSLSSAMKRWDDDAFEKRAFYPLLVRTTIRPCKNIILNYAHTLTIYTWTADAAKYIHLCLSMCVCVCACSCHMICLLNFMQIFGAVFAGRHATSVRRSGCGGGSLFFVLPVDPGSLENAKMFSNCRYYLAACVPRIMWVYVYLSHTNLGPGSLL